MTEMKKAKKAVSNATTRTKNAAEVAKGTLKAKTGKTLGDHHLEAKGKVETTKGRVKQTGQRLKETLER